MKKAKKEKGEDATPAEKKELTAEEKEYKSKRKQIQDKLVNEGPYVVWAQPTRYYGSTIKVSGVKTDPVFMLDLNALTK